LALLQGSFICVVFQISLAQLYCLEDFVVLCSFSWHRS